MRPRAKASLKVDGDSCDGTALSTVRACRQPGENTNEGPQARQVLQRRQNKLACEAEVGGCPPEAAEAVRVFLRAGVVHGAGTCMQLWRPSRASNERQVVSGGYMCGEASHGESACCGRTCRRCSKATRQHLHAEAVGGRRRRCSASSKTGTWTNLHHPSFRVRGKKPRLAEAWCN